MFQNLYADVRLTPLEDKITGLLPSKFSHPALVELEKKSPELPATFRDQKRRVSCVLLISRRYPQYYNEGFVRAVVKEGVPDKFRAKENDSWSLSFLLSASNAIFDSNIHKGITKRCKRVPNRIFLANIDSYVEEEPLVEPATRHALDTAYDHLSEVLRNAFTSLRPEVLNTQLVQELDNAKQRAFDQSTGTLIEQINSVSDDGTSLSVWLKVFITLAVN